MRRKARRWGEVEVSGEVVNWVSCGDGVDSVGSIRLTEIGPLYGLRWIAAGDTQPAEGTECVNYALAAAVTRAADMHARYQAAEGALEAVRAAPLRLQLLRPIACPP